MPDPLNDNPLNGDFYRQMLLQAAVAVVATDAQFNIVCWNLAAKELLGASAEQMLGQRIDRAVPPERRKLVMKLVQRTARQCQPSSFEFRMFDAHGLQRGLMAIFSPIPVGASGLATDDAAEAPQTKGSEIQGISVWIVDQTHRKRLADRLSQAEKIASLGTLAGGVAHHFNNILGGVATFVDFALTSGNVVAMRRALQMTSEAASRAAKITQSLLSFAEQDAHRTDLADLTEVVLTFAHLVKHR